MPLLLAWKVEAPGSGYALTDITQPRLQLVAVHTVMRIGFATGAHLRC